MSKQEEISKFKSQVKKLISRSRLEEAIDQIDEFASFNERITNKLVLLSSRYYGIKNSQSEGIIDFKTFNLSMNEVKNSLLELIDDLSEEDFISILENSEVVKKLKNEISNYVIKIEEKEVEISDLIKVVDDKEQKYLELINELEKCKQDKLNSRILESRTIKTIDIIKQGEGEQVEFRLSWNKNSFEGIINVISAFMNTRGGVILIGVNDEGQIKGIEITSLNTIDKIRHDIINLASKRIGHQFTRLITLDAEQIGEKIIFRIDCEISDSPVFVRNFKNGEESEEFFVRTGGINAKLKGMNEIFNYIRKRF